MKTAAQAANKWKNGTAGAQALYVQNATAAAQSQVSDAVAMADAWLSGVTTAGTKSYVAGLNASGQKGTYAKKVASVGGARYADGTAKSTDTFTTQIGKVLTVEAGVPLSPKGPKGSQANILRATEMIQALRAAKLAGQFQ